MIYLTNLKVCVIALAREHDRDVIFNSECSDNLTERSISNPSEVSYNICSHHQDNKVLYRHLNEDKYPSLEMAAIGVALTKGTYDERIATIACRDD